MKRASLCGPSSAQPVTIAEQELKQLMFPPFCLSGQLLAAVEHTAWLVSAPINSFLGNWMHRKSVAKVHTVSKQLVVLKVLRRVLPDSTAKQVLIDLPLPYLVSMCPEPVVFSKLSVCQESTQALVAVWIV